MKLALHCDDASDPRTPCPKHSSETRPRQCCCQRYHKLAPVSIHQDRVPLQSPLTTIETPRPRHIVRTASKRTPNTRSLAPDQLREMPPRSFIVRIVVRVLQLLLMPSVHHGPSKLQPHLVLRGRRGDGGEIAAAAVLYIRLVSTGYDSEALLRRHWEFLHVEASSYTH
jgi:hypothetical protein